MEMINPTDCPYYLFSRISLVMTSVFKKSFLAAGLGRVKPSYLGVLWCLWMKEGIKTIELGRCAGLEPSTMTGLIDRMERDGFVVRTADPEDRRAQVIHLTESGRNIKERIVKLVDETLALLFIGIPQEKLDGMNDVMRAILSNAQGE